MRRDEGVTTVEFALVLPIFLIVIAAGAYFGWYMYVQSQLERAATRAARYAAVPTTTGDYSFCPSSVLTVVNNHLNTEHVSASELTVADSTATLASNATCPATPRSWVKVTISHPFSNPFTTLVSWITPISGTITVTGSGQADVETP